MVGVVDGLALRTEPPKRSSHVVELKDDEALTVLDQRGRPLFELRGGAAGPTLACLSENLSVAVDGELHLEGRRVSIRAREGEAHIEASDDVVVEGEHIHLN